MGAKLKTAVLGATGYSGLELTRILLRHPRLEKPSLLRASSDNGGAVGSGGCVSGVFLEMAAIRCIRFRGRL